MKKQLEFNMSTASVGAIVFYAVCGLLLVLLPTEALSIANYAIAALFGAVGVFNIFRYIKSRGVIGTFGFTLALGLVLLCFSVLMFCYPTFLATILPKIWGISLLIGGFGKIQASADLQRIQERRWWIMLIGAAFSFVLGVMCLANPIYIAETIFVFIGICLLAEAVLDLVAFLLIRTELKKYQKEARQVQEGTV